MPHTRYLKPSLRHGPAAAVLILALLVASTGSAAAAEPGEPLTIGRIVRIPSKVIGEERTIFVTTPPGYDRFTQQRYPVVYVLDGEGNHILAASVAQFLSRNGLMAPAIVVGIPNTDRTRDFTPTAAADRPGTGGGPRFMEFLKAELIPWVERSYRTQPYRVLIGHSLCGMYAVWALLTQPDLFQGLVAVSPYVMYDNDYVVRLAAERLPTLTDTRRCLFITLGDEPAYNDALGRLLGLLKEKAPKGTEFRYVPFGDKDHGSVLLDSIHQGLAAIYAGWRPTGDLAALGIQGLEEHYRQLSQRYGYAIAVPEALVNQMGYQYLQGRQDTATAIAVFQRNVELFPDSANVYDSLGEALEKAGRLEDAARNYRQAVSQGEKSRDPNLNVFRQNLARVEAALKGEGKAR